MSSAGHILVVEDEAHLALGIKFNLEAEGYRVTTVDNGPAAIEFISHDDEVVDLVVLDIMLPEMSGYAVCELVRARDEQVPILILSARKLSDDRRRAFDVGANQYLTKPFELDELISRAKNLIRLHGPRAKPERPSRSQPTGVLRFGEAKVDFDSFQATVRGERIGLTRLEADLLHYFSSHEGRVIPRSELLERVWQLPGNLASRAPDQFIRRLRKIFELEPGAPRHFLTVRDAGYRFVAEPPP